MKLGTIVKSSFIASILITLFASYLKIIHAANAEYWMIAGVFAVLVFIVSAIYEVRTSTRIHNSEKNMWTFAFIFFSGLAGIIYFLMGRRRIVSES